MRSSQCVLFVQIMCFKGRKEPGAAKDIRLKLLSWMSWYFFKWFSWLLRRSLSIVLCRLFATEMASQRFFFYRFFPSLFLSPGDGGLFIFRSCLHHLTAEPFTVNNCSLSHLLLPLRAPRFLKINLSLIARFQLSPCSDTVSIFIYLLQRHV